MTVAALHFWRDAEPALKGIFVHSSNRLENLADLLAKQLAEAPRAPLEPLRVIVQSQGMGRWLQMRLADRMGICAAVEFPFPQRFIEEKLYGARRLTSPINDPEVLSWRLMKLLLGIARELRGDEQHSEIRRALAGFFDGGSGNACGDVAQLKLYRFARALAAAFDEYLIYRPELILRWEETGEATATRAKHSLEDWQRLIWTEITDAGGEGHFAQCLRELWSSPGLANLDNYSAIHVFGVATLPPAYLRIFEKLSQRQEVHFFQFQPSQQYWGDLLSRREVRQMERKHLTDFTNLFSGGEDAGYPDASPSAGHPLLASWGQLGRNHLEELFELPVAGGEEHFESPGQNGESALTLHRLQQEVLELDSSSAETSREYPADGSLQIHCCHNRLREMEVLRDFLLGLFSQEELRLQPRDIVVMAPEIENYVPYIRAVFDAAETKAQEIPYTIADRHPLGQCGPVQVLRQLMDLPENRLAATELLDILSHPVVLSGLHLDDAQTEQFLRVLASARPRWGENGAHRADLGLPGTEQHSWRHALDRLHLAFAAGGMDRLIAENPEDESNWDDGQATSFEGVAPSAGLPSDLWQGAGRFEELMASIFALRKSFSEERPVEDWVHLLQDFAERHLNPSDCSPSDQIRLREALNGLRSAADKAGFGAPVSLQVIRDAFDAQLEGFEHPHGFLGGGITFCALKPMRSIPFQVVWIAGLDQEAFPRRRHRPGFDLMAVSPRRGDRDVRQDDRYLFLESLLSARQAFCLSYSGKDSSTGSERPPSMLVGELLDYLGESSAEFVRDHRLHAFHPRYFATGKDAVEPEPTSFSKLNLEVARSRDASKRTVWLPFVPGKLAARDFAERPEEVALDELREFLLNPARALLRKRLRISLENLEEDFSDREPFEIAPLDKYAIRWRLVQAGLSGHGLEEVYAWAAACGLLPHGEAGRSALAAMHRQTQNFIENVRLEKAARVPLPSRPFSLRTGDIRINGTVNHLTEQGIFRYRPSQAKARDRVGAWLHHLALCQIPVDETHEVKRASLILLEGRGNGRAKVERMVWPELSAAEAASFLRDLLGLYREGWERPLPLFPESSWAFAEARHAEKQMEDQEQSRKRRSPYQVAADKWYGTGYFQPNAPAPEVEDPYLQHCFGRQPDFKGEFEELAMRVYEPMLRFRAN